MPSNPAPASAVMHAAVSGASRRPSEARNERSEWRREGYPPEGPRPRSGLGRVARSRSDAPKLLAPRSARRSGSCTITTITTIITTITTIITTITTITTIITITTGIVVRVTMIVVGIGGGDNASVGVSISIIGGVSVIAVINIDVTVSGNGPASPSRMPTRTTAAVGAPSPERCWRQQSAAGCRSCLGDRATRQEGRAAEPPRSGRRRRRATRRRTRVSAAGSDRNGKGRAAERRGP